MEPRFQQSYLIIFHENLYTYSTRRFLEPQFKLGPTLWLLWRHYGNQEICLESQCLQANDKNNVKNGE